MWAVADIETGKIIETRQTKNKEFSDASYKVKYNVEQMLNMIHLKSITRRHLQFLIHVEMK